jgi:hypothetical protein
MRCGGWADSGLGSRFSGLVRRVRPCLNFWKVLVQMKLLQFILPSILISLAAVQAADVDLYGVTKAQSYRQTSSAEPALLPTGAYSFAAIVDPNTATSVTSASLRLPDLVTIIPFGNVPGVGPFAISQPFDTLAALDAAFPAGGYRFTIAAVNDGNKTPTLNLGANAYPTTPRVTNFDAAQAIDWTQDFTLTWVTFAGGTSSDAIQFLIRRKNGTTLFATPTFGSAGALNGTSTSVLIPANTFVPGETYTATLAFINIVNLDLTSYGLFLFVPGATAFSKTTEFPMKAPGTVPNLIIATGTAAGSYRLQWNADIGRRYDLVRSQDFLTWVRVALVTATSPTESRTDTPAASVKSRFYRLQEPP